MANLVKIVGKRGEWLASVDGEPLPVIHNTWRVGKDGYSDPKEGVDRDGEKYLEYVARLRETDRVVLQEDREDGSLARADYIGVFRFSDLAVAEDGAISLKLVARVADPRR